MPARRRVKPSWHGSPRANNLATRSILDGAMRASAKTIQRLERSSIARRVCAGKIDHIAKPLNFALGSVTRLEFLDNSGHFFV